MPPWVEPSPTPGNRPPCRGRVIAQWSSCGCRPRAKSCAVMESGRLLSLAGRLAVPPRGPFSSIEEALEDIRAGRMVVVCDDEDRENEGDLTIAAQFAGPDAINFMAMHGRGLICLSLTAERCDQLRLDPMARNNESPFQTAFTVSIESRLGVSTGISARDRARTIEV